MLASFFGTLGEKKGALEFKLALYLVLGIVAIVIISLLLDGIKKVIRGLDTAALGALLIWVGSKVSKLKVIGAVSKLFFLVGWTLLIVGLLVFIILKLIKLKRNKRKRRDEPPMPLPVAGDENEQPPTTAGDDLSGKKDAKQ